MQYQRRAMLMTHDLYVQEMNEEVPLRAFAGIGAVGRLCGVSSAAAAMDHLMVVAVVDCSPTAAQLS